MSTDTKTRPDERTATTARAESELDEHLVHELSEKAGQNIRKLALTIKANPKLRKEIEELAHDLEGSVPRLAKKANSGEALIDQVNASVEKAKKYIENVAIAEEKHAKEEEKEKKEKAEHEAHAAHRHDAEKPESADKTIQEKAHEKLEAFRAEIRGEKTSETTSLKESFPSFTPERDAQLGAEKDKYIAEAEKARLASLSTHEKALIRLEELHKEIQAKPAGTSIKVKTVPHSGKNKPLTRTELHNNIANAVHKNTANERLEKLRKQAQQRNGQPKRKMMGSVPAQRKQIITAPPFVKSPENEHIERRSSLIGGLLAGLSNDQSDEVLNDYREETMDRGSSAAGNPRSASTNQNQDDDQGGGSHGKGRMARQAYNHARSGGSNRPSMARGGGGAGRGIGAAGQAAKNIGANGGRAVARVAAQAAVRGIALLFTTPVGWVILAIIFIVLIILLLFFGEGADQAAKRAQSCAAPKESMTVNITGPADGTVGPELTYEVRVADTLPNQEVTITATVPNGQNFIRSSWARNTVAGKVITWKASENLPPNSLSPPNFTFTITLTAQAANSNEVLVVDATPARSGTAGGSTIVIDPGHGQESNVTDPETGLIDRESGNTPEREEVFDVAQQVKTTLESKGYTVILTKNSPTEGMTHRRRAEIANTANAAIAVSIHNDHGQPFSWSEVYTQKVGLYREANGTRVAFTDAAIAAKSAEYGSKIAAARAVTEGRAVPLKDANFDTREGYSSGNIPLVMLFAKVPWVYNEIGAAPVGVRVPQDQIDKYAQGIAAGIEQSVPTSASSSAGGTTGAGCPPGGGGAPGGPISADYVPPSADTCGGKYTLNNTTKMNFGDPQCNFNKDALYTQLKTEDPANADVWFNKVIPCESGFNPNAFADPIAVGTPDSAGAWGLYQMGSASPPGTAPPAPGKNGINDRGDVPWVIQTTNATTYGKKISRLGAYWSCAR